MTQEKDDEIVLAPETEIVRRLPTLAGFVEKFDPHLVISVPIAAFVFTADLLRLGTLPKLPLYFLNVQQPQPGDLIGTHRINARGQLPSLQDKRVLLLDSCRDSGNTMRLTKGFLASMGVAQIMSLVAVDKNVPTATTKVSGSLFKFTDELGKANPFIYGYGMDDSDGSKRGLPYIAYKRTKPDGTI